MTRSRCLILVCAALALVATIYCLPRAAVAADNPGFEAGASIRVYFRGDAAGQAVQSYINSVSNNASVSGMVKSIDDQWLVISSGERTLYIPRPVILMIEKSK